MNTEESNENLSFLLLCTSECERVVEASRQELCSNPNFDPYSAFQLLDHKAQGKISWTDIKFFLSKRSMAITRQYLELLILQYDSNMDNLLSLDEFKPFVLCSENPELVSTALNRRVFPPSLYVESLLARHIELECNWQGRLMMEKKRLGTGFPVVDSFRVLSAGNDGFVDARSLKVFLAQFEKGVGIEDCRRIVRRIDTDDDLKVSYQDFVAFVMIEERNRSEGMCVLKKSRDLDMKRCKTESSVLVTRERVSTPRSKIGWEEEEIKLDIKKVFDPVIQIQFECEKAKVALTSHLDFSFDELIKLIDKENKNFVTRTDIECVLNDLSIDYSTEEIDLILLLYSRERDLSYSQVKDLLVPLNFKDHKRVSRYQDEGFRIFSADTLNDLITCLKTILHSQILLENLRKSLGPTPESTLFQAFQQIDRHKSGSISLPTLRTFLSNSNYCELQIRLLYKTFSKSLHNEITYSDFKQELTPKLR